MKVYSQAVARLSTVVLGIPGPAAAALGGDFRGTCLDSSLLTLPGFTLAHGTSVTCLTDSADRSLSKPPETVGDGDIEENKSFLKKKKKKKLIDGRKTKKENIAAQDNQDLRRKIFRLMARYKDTEINSSPFACSGLHVGLWGT